MTWLFLSLLTALSVAVRDISVKIFCRELPPLKIGAAELFWSLPLLIVGVLSIPWPVLDEVFWLAFGISLPVNGIAYILYLHAIKLSPISLTVPLLAFTPVFMIVTGNLVLAEKINSLGAIGIFLIVIGSYVLHFDKGVKGFWQPFAAFSREKGAWFMLLVAFIFSYAAVLGKQAMIHSSPLFFTYTFFLAFNVLLLFGFFILKKTSWPDLISFRWRGCLLGGLLFFHVSCHGLAIMLNTAAYMIAVKRSSIVFTVILSGVILREDNFRIRFLGTLIMFLGVIIIAIWG